MRELFISECRRFAPAAAIAALVHLLLQMYAFRSNILVLELDINRQFLVLIFAVIAGVAFAVAQIGSYRQPNRWLWLLHRPISRLAIFGAIALSALAMFVIAVGIPALMTVSWIDWTTAQPVGFRHYACVPYLIMVCSIAWLIGASILLSPTRFAFLAIFIPYVFVLNEATAWVCVLAAIAVAAFLALVVYGQFQPDRRMAPNGKLATAVAAAPLALGFYFVLLWGGSAVFQIGLTAIGAHPLNQAVPPTGGYIEAHRTRYKPNRDLVLAGLANSTDPRAEHWKRQLALKTAVALRIPSITRYAVPQQLSNREVMRFSDQDTNFEYVFDHQAMRFKGIDPATGADRGWSGLGGLGSQAPFPGVPRILDGYIMTPQLALTNDAASGRYLPRVQLPAGERLTTPPMKMADRFYVLSNLRLIVYSANVAKPDAPYLQLHALSFISPIDDAHWVNIAPLPDGMLVSTTNLLPLEVGDDGIAQHVYFVDNEGRQSVVAQRKLKRDFPLLFEHAPWLASPALSGIISGTHELFEVSGGPDHASYRAVAMPRFVLPQPAPAWYAALLLMAISGAYAWFRQRSAAWMLACIVIGLPGLAAMLVLVPKRAKENAGSMSL